MANPLTDVEAESVVMLQAANSRAFSYLLAYFDRMYSKEVKNCVDCNIDVVDIHRGKARAFRDAKNILADARKRINED